MLKVKQLHWPMGNMFDQQMLVPGPRCLDAVEELHLNTRLPSETISTCTTAAQQRHGGHGAFMFHEKELCWTSSSSFWPRPGRQAPQQPGLGANVAHRMIKGYRLHDSCSKSPSFRLIPLAPPPPKKKSEEELTFLPILPLAQPP